MAEELLSITQVGELSGLQSSALRYYERSGLIASHGRQGGQRHYKPEVLQRLATVALLQEVGFTISEIATLVRSKGRQNRWRALASGKLAEIDEHLERVQRARDLLTAAVDCGCSSLESCDLITSRRGRHNRTIQTRSLRIRPPD